MTATLLSLGDVFEQRYELLQVLGSGGVGTVYLARQLDAERTVAIKILQPELASDEELKQRFLREAQILSRIKHENVVQVHHLGISSLALPFIVMEYVAGKPLRGLITEQGALGVERSISIIRQCASALIEVHSSGIIHRDLKPENIVLADERMPGSVKIIDFGLARVEDSAKQQQVLTSTGFLIGTVAYMSPEQCRGVRVDPRSDIYSLSLCFYEMLKGKPPFEADSTMGLMYKQINEALPLLESKTFGTASDDLNAFLKKGLAKAPDERFQSAEEMLSALDELADTAGGAAFVEKAKCKRLVLLTSAVAAFLFLLLVFGLKFGPSFLNRATVAPLSPPLPHGGNVPSFDPEDPRNDPGIRRVLDNPSVDKESKIQLLLKYADSFVNYPRAINSLKIAKELCSKPLRKSKEYLRYLVAHELGLQLLQNGDYKNALENLEPVLEIEGTDKISSDFGTHRVQESKAGVAFCAYSLGDKERARKLVNELTTYEGGLHLTASQRAMTIALGLKDDRLIKKLILTHGSASNCASYAQLFRKAKRYDLLVLALQKGKTTPIDLEFEQPEAVHLAIATQEAELLCARGNKVGARKVLKNAMEGVNLPLALQYSYWQVHFLHALKASGLDEELLNYQSLSEMNELSLLKAEVLCSQKKFEEARKVLEDKPYYPAFAKQHALRLIDLMQAGKLSITSPLIDSPEREY